MARQGRAGFCVLPALSAAAQYGWAYRYYGGLLRSGHLLSVSQVTPETLSGTLFQNFTAWLPLLLLTAMVLVRMGWRRFWGEMGLAPQPSKKHVLILAAGVNLLALAAALLFVKLEPLVVGCQWGYYLFFVAVPEELMFRGLMPLFLEQGGAPAPAVWAAPGVLFAWMHTLTPMVSNGFTLGSFLWTGLSLLAGYTLAHCGFYALRRWSGTLWLPVLIHGTLDFMIVFQ